MAHQTNIYVLLALFSIYYLSEHCTHSMVFDRDSITNRDDAFILQKSSRNINQTPKTTNRTKPSYSDHLQIKLKSPLVGNNATTSHPNNTSTKKPGLVDRRNHEELSSSFLSSSYNFLNGQNKNISSSKSGNTAKDKAVALGKENQSVYSNSNKHHGQESVPSDFILSPPSGLVPYAELPSQVYGQQVMIPSDAQQQDQILTSFYANAYPNNQQLVVPNNFRDMAQMHSGSNSEGAMYNQFQRPDMQPNLEGGIYSNDGGNGHSSGHRKHSKSSDKGSASLLSNDQLASLIDELKDFNSRQASKITNNILPEHSPPRETKENKMNDEDDEDEDGDDKLDVSASKNNDNKNEEDVSAKKSDGSKMNAEDLAKFAKFLMTKEGSNLKFQLGLEKESPDDGDEDDRDALLESKKKSTRRKHKKVPKTELDDLDKKHSEVEKQMERLLADMSDTLKKGEKNKRKRKRKNQLSDDYNPEVNGRRRRDHTSSIDANRTQEFEDVTTGDKQFIDKKRDTERDQDQNFAKMLLQKELSDEKQERIVDSLEGEPKKTANKTLKKRNKRPKFSSDRGLHHERPKSSRNENNNGDSYEKGSGRDAKGYLEDELRASREKKYRMRSRLPLASSSPTILKRTLDEELSAKTSGRRKFNENDPIEGKQPKNNNNIQESSYSDRDLNPSTPDSENQRTDGSNNHDGNRVDRVSFQSPPITEDEYPVSDKVIVPLNKLSNNIDRLFKDSFLPEVESKSRYKGFKSRTEKRQSAPREQNVQENEKMKMDDDFDVNVGIDGKRDMDAEEDSAGLKKNANDENENGTNRDESRQRIRRSKVDGKPISRKPSSSLSSKARSRQTEEPLKTESLKWDPVDNESLDTPIGPDNDNFEGEMNKTKKIRSE